MPSLPEAQSQAGCTDRRARNERDRRRQESQPRHRRRPRKVLTDRRPDRVRHNRVLPMKDRVGPPRERPHQDGRVRALADQVAARVGCDRDAEVQERDSQVRREDQTFAPYRLAAVFDGGATPTFYRTFRVLRGGSRCTGPVASGGPARGRADVGEAKSLFLFLLDRPAQLSQPRHSLGV